MKPEGKEPAGLQKPHRVAQVDANGTVIPGTETEMTQADWKARDKSATPRLVRIDEAGEQLPEEPTV